MLRLSKEEFEAWRGHRVTEQVHKYLEDRENGIRDKWSDGEGWTDENRHYVHTLEYLRTLDYEEMEEFYDQAGEGD